MSTESVDIRTRRLIEYDRRNDEVTTPKGPLFEQVEAIRERWPIAPHQRQRIFDEAMKIVETPHINPAFLLQAVKVIVAMDSLNLKEKELQLKAMPRAVVHSTLSMEELQALVSTKLNELGLTNRPLELTNQ
jgi:hypothetical protein